MASKGYLRDIGAATAIRANIKALPNPNEARAAAPYRSPDAFFAELSRELRWSLDADQRLLLLEGAWTAVLGWQPERLRGWYWEEIVHPVDRAGVAVALAGLQARGGYERDVELRLADAEGRYHLMSWTFVAGSGPHSILGVGHDLAAPPAQRSHTTPDTALLQRRNAELATRLAELEERFTAVERFAGTAAHQLAEPLVIAESSAILVAEELGPDLDPMLRGRLDAIGRSAGRARRLMDALLADARTSGHPLEASSVDLGPVVEEALEALAIQIEERAATAVVGRLPTVRGEGGLLAVIVENLLSNALKYGPRAGGTIVIDAQRCAEGWRITFVDEGKPIPADQVSRIFEPFHRVPGERRIPGVGLGLTVCTRLAGRLGGTIGVDPGRDSGNTFWLLLPDAA